MKKNLLGVAAVVLGLSLSAFTLKGKAAHPTGQSVYYFFGTTSAEQSNPAYYNQTPITCAGTALRCEIMATPLASNPGEPDLNQPVTVVSTKN